MATPQDIIDALANLRSAVVDLSKRIADPHAGAASGARPSGEELWRRSRQFSLGRPISTGRHLFGSRKHIGLGGARKGLRRFNSGGQRAARFATRGGAGQGRSGRLGGLDRLGGAAVAKPLPVPLDQSAAIWGRNSAAALLLAALDKRTPAGGSGLRFDRSASAAIGMASGSSGAADQFLGRRLSAYDGGDEKTAALSSFRKELEEAIQQASKDAIGKARELSAAPTEEVQESTSISKWIREAAEIGASNRKRADERIRAMKERGARDAGGTSR